MEEDVRGGGGVINIAQDSEQNFLYFETKDFLTDKFRMPKKGGWMDAKREGARGRGKEKGERKEKREEEEKGKVVISAKLLPVLKILIRIL